MADSPIITCPECRKKFKGKENLVGKRIKCPLCATPFVVPGEKNEDATKPAAVAAENSAPAAESKPPLAFANDDDEEKDQPKSYGVTELDIAPRCPNCANLMENEKAFICLFC